MIKLIYALIVASITIVMSAVVFGGISYVATDNFFEFPKASLFATVIIFGPWYYSIDVLIKTAIAKHFYMKCLREFDCMDDLSFWRQGWNSAHWDDLHAIAKCFSRIPKKSFYGNYEHRVDDYNQLVKDTCFILVHLYQDRDYVNKLHGMDFNENIGVLYLNDIIEDDFIVKRRWKFYLDNMIDCEEKEELARRYNEKFDARYGVEFKSVPDHLNKDLL